MNNLTVSRRSFIGGTLAAMGGLALAGNSLANVTPAKAPGRRPSRPPAPTRAPTTRPSDAARP